MGASGVGLHWDHGNDRTQMEMILSEKYEPAATAPRLEDVGMSVVERDEAAVTQLLEHIRQQAL